MAMLPPPHPDMFKLVHSLHGLDCRQTGGWHSTEMHSCWSVFTYIWLDNWLVFCSLELSSLAAACFINNKRWLHVCLKLVDILPDLILKEDIILNKLEYPKIFSYNVYTCVSAKMYENDVMYRRMVGSIALSAKTSLASLLVTAIECNNTT